MSLGDQLKTLAKNYHEQKNEEKKKFAIEWLKSHLELNRARLVLAAEEGLFLEILCSITISPVYRGPNKEEETYFKISQYIDEIRIENIRFSIVKSKFPGKTYDILAHWN